MVKIQDFAWEYLRLLFGIKKYSQILNKNTSPYIHGALLIIWLFTLLKRTHFRELSISRFTIQEKPFYVVNLEMDNLLKWVQFFLT